MQFQQCKQCAWATCFEYENGLKETLQSLRRRPPQGHWRRSKPEHLHRNVSSQNKLGCSLSRSTCHGHSYIHPANSTSLSSITRLSVPRQHPTATAHLSSPGYASQCLTFAGGWLREEAGCRCKFLAAMTDGQVRCSRLRSTMHPNGSMISPTPRRIQNCSAFRGSYWHMRYSSSS